MTHILAGKRKTEAKKGSNKTKSKRGERTSVTERERERERETKKEREEGISVDKKSICVIRSVHKFLEKSVNMNFNSLAMSS